MDGAWGWAMAAFMIAVIIGTLALLIWLLAGSRSRRREETPDQVLDRRLATGEITPEEYRERSALLGTRREGDRP